MTEDQNTLFAHFAAVIASPGYKKGLEAKDLYKGRKTQAQEERERAQREAVERAKARLKGTTLNVHPKIQAVISKNRPKDA